MKPTTITLPRYEPMNGWTGRILRVDLSEMRIWAQETAPYVPKFLGARGIAAKLCWDEFPEPVGEFDPANPLMVFPGALTGTRAPYSGRTNICAFSPQAWPHHWFTRSSVGAHFGGELKRAGYDGLVVTGASETPVRIRIRDDQVSILPADDLWGLDALATLDTLESIDGKGTRSLAIGQAGERLSRIATIMAGSSNAAGQGGFGAVMGAKKLKAISVQATGRVSMAHPEAIRSLARALAANIKRDVHCLGDLEGVKAQVARAGGGGVRVGACTEGCVTPCRARFVDMPAATSDGKISGDFMCVAVNMFPGLGERALSLPSPVREMVGWQMDLSAAFEMNVLTNRYGLNQFDVLMGMVPWLVGCQHGGLISDLNGTPMDWNSPAFWAEFLHAVAYRQGLGDALAEGGWAASRALRMGEDLADWRYPGWGQPTHWDGHGSPNLKYPFWIVSALQWLADSRDPFNNAHGYNRTRMVSDRIFQAPEGDARVEAMRFTRELGQRLYGDPDSLDPTSGYRGKAYPAYLHTIRPVLKDTVPVDDLVFPLQYDPRADDGLWVLRDVEGMGDVPGPDVESRLFAAGTGLDWSPEELDHAAARVVTMERALLVRHWARSRATDELVLPFFERPELGINPLIGQRQSLDRDRFGPVLDEFYALQGWDPETGWPTRKRLQQLGLGDVHDPMVVGATRARQRRDGAQDESIALPPGNCQ